MWGSKEQKLDQAQFKLMMDGLDKKLAGEKLDQNIIGGVKSALDKVEVMYFVGNNRVGAEGLKRFQSLKTKLEKLSKDIDDVKKESYVNNGGIQSPRADNRDMPKHKR